MPVTARGRELCFFRWAMGQFQIRTLLWLTSCAALAAWLLTWPPWLTFSYQGGVEWLNEFDYGVRISFAAALFVLPYALAWFSQYWEDNRDWLGDGFWISFCGMTVVVTLWLLMTVL
jgi:hypothetical protein